MQGAKHQVTGLGRLQGRCQGVLVADFPNQDHIGILPQGSPQRRFKLPGVLPNLAVAHQGLVAFVHKLHRILNREDVAGHGAVDVVHHRSEGGAFARSCGPCDQHQALGLAAQLLEHLG